MRDGEREVIGFITGLKDSIPGVTITGYKFNETKKTFVVWHNMDKQTEKEFEEVIANLYYLWFVKRRIFNVDVVSTLVLEYYDDINTD